jgi:RNA polymerase sigma-70 factor (ECF subfamily)
VKDHFEVDGDELAALYQEYNTRLVRFARALVGDNGVAEELAQTAWVQFGTAKLAGTADEVVPGDNVALLFHIVRMRVIDWKRHTSPETTFAAFESEAIDRVLREHTARLWSGAPDDPELIDRRIDVLGAVNRLPRRQKEAVALHYLLDLTIDDVAAVMGISPNTVKGELRQAMLTLRGQPALVGYEEGRM